MSLKRPAKDQPQSFEFNNSSLEEAKKIISKYPKGKQQSIEWLYLAAKGHRRALINFEGSKKFTWLIP